MGDGQIGARTEGRLNIAVIGSGIAGLSAAWLLARHHDVTLFESDQRLGGHSHTVDAAGMPVDTGFIVYNEFTYPNLSALFNYLDVDTQGAPMSFAVSLDAGALEYCGSGIRGLLAQPANALRPRFWRMMLDLLRFYRSAPGDCAAMAEAGEDLSLGNYLDRQGYSSAFRDDHLLPMAAAIWSTPAAEVGRYPAAAFVRFCQTHGLLQLRDRPFWRTVAGGSRQYVQRLAAAIPKKIMGTPIRAVRRLGDTVEVLDGGRTVRRFDHVVIATHADQALALLGDASAEERRLLGAFRYNRNEAVLHGDARLMPRRRRVWSSWNYLSRTQLGERKLSVTYWMNRLQQLPESRALFVTLNPFHEPHEASVIRRDVYEHPLFDAAAMSAQRQLWSLQGLRNTWFCGAYFGAGFHEDGLQAGLAVAEELGGVRRPWVVAQESGRISLPVRPSIRTPTRVA